MNSVRLPPLSLVPLIAALLSTPVPVAGQEDTDPAERAAACTFDRCGLRLQYRTVFRGAEAERVARMGMYYADLRFLEAAADSAGILARAAARGHERSALLEHVAQIATIIGYSALLYSRDEQGDSRMSWTSLGLGIAGWQLERIAERRNADAYGKLSRAVWWYNRDVAAGRVPSDRPPLPPLRPDHFARAGAAWGYFVGGAAGVLLAVRPDAPEEPVLELVALPVATAAVGWLVGRLIPRGDEP